MFPEQLNYAAAPLSRYLVTRVEETITSLLLSVLHEDPDIVDCGWALPCALACPALIDRITSFHKHFALVIKLQADNHTAFP